MLSVKTDRDHDDDDEDRFDKFDVEGNSAAAAAACVGGYYMHLPRVEFYCVLVYVDNLNDHAGRRRATKRHSLRCHAREPRRGASTLT